MQSLSAAARIHLLAPPWSALSGVLPDRRRMPSPGELTVLVADTRRTRRRGLARLDALPGDVALLIAPCRSVHTVGMRFALDLVWLDGAGAVVRIDRAVAPRRLRSCRAARAVLECRAGRGERFAAALQGANRRVVAERSGNRP